MAVEQRACDWLSLGPILGVTTERSTRILAQPFAQDEGLVELRIAKAGPGVRFNSSSQGFGPVEVVGPVHRVAPTCIGEFRTVVFELDDLEPQTRYFYEVVPIDAPASTAGGFASTQPFCLRTSRANPSSIQFTIHSCNGLHKPPRHRRPTAMWGRLLREAVENPELDFAILAGDQVYADAIREEWQREWEPDFDPYHPSVSASAEAKRCREFLDDLPRRYEQVYRAFWRRPEIRPVEGHLPCGRTWDEGERYDGWGSHGDEELRVQQMFFAAAAKAFDAFSFALAPPTTLSPAAAQLRQGHRGFTFMLGDVAFVVLDLRSQRNVHARGPSAVLGETQWAWLEAELEAIVERRPRQIVVVTSIPLVHLGAAVQILMPRASELYDDVIDHWNSRPNRSDQARLLGKLFQARKATGANVLLLGGDVHVATVGAVVSDDRRFLLDGETQATLHQGVSSGIAHESLTGIAANTMRWLCQREHPLRGSFVGRVDEMIFERNFAVVSTQANSAFRFTVFSENNGAPEQFYFGLLGG